MAYDGTITYRAKDIRAQLLEIETAVRSFMKDAVADDGDEREVRAQTMLTVRHLEDAQMRLGKVCQYDEGGGVSCLSS